MFRTLGLKVTIFFLRDLFKFSACFSCSEIRRGECRCLRESLFLFLLTSFFLFQVRPPSVQVLNSVISSLHSWRDFARECFCFGGETVKVSGKAAWRSVRSRGRGDWWTVEGNFTRGFPTREFPRRSRWKKKLCLRRQVLVAPASYACYVISYHSALLLTVTYKQLVAGRAIQ